MTQGPPSHDNPSLAENGRFTAFASDRTGRGNIWLTRPCDGERAHVAASSFVQRFPVSNDSGDKIAFSVYEKDKRVVYVSAPGGAPERLCEGCLRATDWSRDEKTLLVSGGDPYQINVLDIASRRQIPLVKHPDYDVLYGRLSPDNRWVSFTARVQPDRAASSSRLRVGRGRFPRAPGSPLRRQSPMITQSGRPTGRRCILRLQKMDIRACGVSESMRAHADRSAKPSRCSIFTGACFLITGDFRRPPAESPFRWSKTTGNVWMMSRSGAR